MDDKYPYHTMFDIPVTVGNVGPDKFWQLPNTGKYTCQCVWRVHTARESRHTSFRWVRRVPRDIAWPCTKCERTFGKELNSLPEMFGVNTRVLIWTPPGDDHAED